MATTNSKPFSFRTVEGAGGVPLNVVSAGDPSNPPILMLHGFGQSYLSFELQLTSRDLTDQFHLVAFDLRGHGNSGKPWNPEAYQDYKNFAGDVQAVVEALHLDRPILLGWSYGNLVISDYIRAYGAEGRVRGIVMVGGYGGLVPSTPLPAASNPFPPEIRDKWLSSHIEDNIAAARRMVGVQMVKLPDAFRERWSHISMLLPPYARKWLLARRQNNVDLVAKISVPLLLTPGDQDVLMDPAKGEELVASQQIPGGARVVVFQGTGHGPFIEDPERYNRELAEFARNVFQGV